MESRFTQVGLNISAKDIVKAYTINKSAAFLVAFLSTVIFNYHGSLSTELTKNEFLPGVKDVIAGFYPNKAIFQILIALYSFFHLLFSSAVFVCIGSQSISLAKLTTLINFTRLVSLLSFTYITADDNITGFNDSFVVYILSNFSWIYLIQSRVRSKAKGLDELRLQSRNIYVGCLLAATFFFYKHQVEKANYAYSISSFFQWLMIALDILFDNLFSADIRDMTISIGFPDGCTKKHIV